ncbi:hypothetical protein [Secundilactobacillus similis]|uniref:Uncharacterized protein n=1 Tax=Secundilactobacillus similis DSM 23365 = JCM 2765 TaxID=1423804 RepID=A0A0R2F323_9LACO|nr:hypothetical protein [Secundilactobacillus similis]KRN22911.1 hypothetical protein FD14_GL000749 [Secundilactobacillus similis DSM 23365 = JCM 2765]
MINETDPSTLSTSGRLLSYNDAVKEGLQTGIKFTELMDQLINTKDPSVLVEAAQALSVYVLDSDFVTFPHQYNTADYYLIFMSRLLELHDKGDLITLQSHEATQHLTQQITAMGDLGTFAFQPADDTGGVYYTEQVTGEVLFYLNLKRQVMRMNSKAITQLFIITYHDKLENEQILSTTQLLIDFGQSLKTDFGFDVDFNLLDTSNQEFYYVQANELSSEVVDKLFVAAAEQDYMLMHAQDGATLQLPQDVTLTIASHTASGQAKWGLTVQDQDEKMSWFKVLLTYDFLRDWYLDNLDELQIRSDALVF